MNENLEGEEELIRLGEIFETLKNDALEVTDLIVKGIEYYKLIGYGSLLGGVICAALLIEVINTGSILNIVLYFILVPLLFILGFYSIWKNRKLGKKHKELVEIHKSLTEE